MPQYAEWEYGEIDDSSNFYRYLYYSFYELPQPAEGIPSDENGEPIPRPLEFPLLGECVWYRDRLGSRHRF